MTCRAISALESTKPPSALFAETRKCAIRFAVVARRAPPYSAYKSTHVNGKAKHKTRGSIPSCNDTCHFSPPRASAQKASRKPHGGRSARGGRVGVLTLIKSASVRAEGPPLAGDGRDGPPLAGDSRRELPAADPRDERRELACPRAQLAICSCTFFRCASQSCWARRSASSDEATMCSSSAAACSSTVDGEARLPPASPPSVAPSSAVTLFARLSCAMCLST